MQAKIKDTKLWTRCPDEEDLFYVVGGKVIWYSIDIFQRQPPHFP